ncbi:MAG: ester cyclase [Chloroflexota bacterium]|nr:ester cyclase [Chloroflexota bacterium]
MSVESNIAAQTRFGDAVNSGDFSAFDEVVAPGAIDHDPAPGQAPGPEGYRQFFTELRTAFPDLKLSLEHLVADADNIAFAYTVSGTHQGPLMGFAPTGKRMQVRGMQISKFADGKMVERWGSSDQLGMLQQLGLAPSA